VLNTLREYDFQDAFKKNGRRAENDAYMRKRTTSRVMVASRPQVIFNQMAEPVLEFMDIPSYYSTVPSFMSVCLHFFCFLHNYYQYV
jgi:hypothetical protein